MPQGREVVERQILRWLHFEVLAQFAEQLRLLDAVDAPIGFEGGIELDDFGRITCLFHDEIDEELFQLLSIKPGGICGRGWSMFAVRFRETCTWRRRGCRC